MPNEPGIRNVDWKTYKTTVDAIELLTGYDLLSLLPDKVEQIVESNTKPPLGDAGGPYSGSEGTAVTLSGSASFDPNGSIVTYSWDFGDDTDPGSGVTPSHTYAQNGTYTVHLTVTDNDGLTDDVTTSVVVSNVAPSISAFAGATLLPGETYTASGSFTDPGADTWSATVNYGDGSGVAALALAGKNFSLSHTYNAAGTFNVTVQVTDDQTSSSRSQTVTVLTPAQGIQNVLALVEVNSLRSKLDNAVKSLEKNNVTPAVNQLEAFLNELDAMVKTGRLAESQALPMRVGIERVIRSLTR
jgi:hypothetical protein